MKPHPRAVAAIAAGALGLSGLTLLTAAPASATDPAGALGAVVINEFSTNGWNGNTDFIELHNHGAAHVDLTGYHLTDDKGIAGGDDIVLDGVLPAGGYTVIFNDSDEHPRGFGLGKSDEVHLLSPDQATLIDAYVDLPEDTHAAPSYARIVDGTGDFARSVAATPGGSNTLAPEDAGVSINEYSSETDFVEIHNFGLTTVDLAGWRLADGEGTMKVGDEIVLGGAAAVLAPGDYLAIETEGSVPSGFTYVDGGFGLNKADHVYLSNDEGALVDTTWVGYEADGATTRHADPSWARTSPGVGLWRMSSAATPGAPNTFAGDGGGAVPALDPRWDDVEINEISSLNDDDPGNPGFGDAVELHNTGDTAVSIEGWHQTDGGAASGARELTLADLKVWDGTAFAPATEMSIPADGYVAFSSTKGLSGEGDAVKIYGPGADAASRQLVDEQAYGDGQAGVSDSFDSDARSFAACPDGSDDFSPVAVNSLGQSNAASCDTRLAPVLDTSVVLNEVSNVAGKAELLNTGTAPVDISAWELVNTAGVTVHTVPASTTLTPGAYYLAEGIFELGSVDSVTIRNAAGAEVVAFSWTEDGIASYQRCESFGTVSYPEAPTATWGEANECHTVETQDWPGSSEVTVADASVDLFTDIDTPEGGTNGEGDVSGVTFAEDGEVLWAIMNKGRLFKLKKTEAGTYDSYDAAWEGGVPLAFADGDGQPDSEGVTVGPDGALYITSERDNERNKSGSWNVVLRYDVSTVTEATVELTATHQWDVHSFVPTGSNLGLEGIAYVPDSFLVDSGWKVGGTAYTAADQPTDGLFATAVEGTGKVHFFSLETGAAPAQVKVESSGFPFAMDVSYDADRQALWALCDDTCGGVYNFLVVEDGDFVVKHSLARPAGMPNLNNEGMAIRPRSTAVDGLVEVVWADDGDTDGFSLREGHLDAAFPAPPVVVPPVVEPPVTEPPVVEPPVTEPSVTEPPVTEPPVVDPPVTEPPVEEEPSAAELAVAAAKDKVATVKGKVSSLKAKLKKAKKAKQPAKAKRLAKKLKQAKADLRKAKKRLKKARAALAEEAATGM